MAEAVEQQTIRVMKMELVAPKQVIDLGVVDMDNPDPQALFKSMVENIGEKPPADSYFRIEVPSTGKKYDMAMLFKQHYLDVATPMNLQTDYQIVTQATMRLIKALNSGLEYHE